MAATKRNASKPDDPRQAKTRAAIQTTQLINRLQYFALGVPCPASKQHVTLSSEELRAIDILLKKALPDLSSIDFSGIMTHDVSDPLKEMLARISAEKRRIGGEP